MRKIFLAILATLLFICNCCYANLKVTMLNVGQGDAILIQTSAQNVLIDTSDADERKKLERELYKAGAYRLDKLILTHPHADHIGNAQYLIKNGVFKVRSVYDNGIASTSKFYLNYLAECASRHVHRKGLKAGDVLDLGEGATLTIFYPTEDLVNFRNKFKLKGDPNNESIVCRLSYGNFSMLFTGDAEAVVEEEILPIIEHCTILKAGHHGSKTSSSKEFVQKVNPDYVFISAGEPTDKRGGNTYGHPHYAALQTYLGAGVDKDKILWTWKNGTITVETDGDKFFEVTAENHANWIDNYLAEKRRQVNMDFENEMADLENQFVMTIDSLASKNDTEHAAINKQLTDLGGGGIMANKSKINPEYYKGTAMADYVSDFGLSFDLGNVVKYVSRAGKKNNELAIEDLEKARWYLNHAISAFERNLELGLKPEFED